jgi:hypothetical protein
MMNLAGIRRIDVEEYRSKELILCTDIGQLGLK